MLYSKICLLIILLISSIGLFAQYLPEDSIPSVDTTTLQGITVNGRHPSIKVEPSKMTIKLSSALLNTDGNILDALQKLPGIIIQNDGTIILNGKSGAIILIDDKLTYLSGENLINYLRSIPANSIDDIELISQPSSKYDAAGSSGIIHLQRKKVKEQGIQLRTSAGVETGRYIRGNENLNLNLRFNKLNLYIDYASFWGKDYIEMSVIGQYLNPETIKPIDIRKDFDTKIGRQTNGHYLKTGLDLDLGSNWSIGSYWSSNWFNRKKNEVSQSDFFNKHRTQSDSTLSAVNKSDYHYSNLTGGISLVYKFAKTGKWDTSLDYQLFDQEDEQLLTSVFYTNIYPKKRDSLSGKANGEVNLYSAQSNLNFGISENFGLNIGVKSILVDINSNAWYESKIAGIWQANPLSSSFSYKEAIYAGYFQFNSKWSRLSAEMGLRLENTYTKNNYISNSYDSTFNKYYLHLFPTLQANYQLSKNNNFSIVYGRRIVRPNYRNMNPFIEVRDPFLYEQGNTELKPELIDNVELSWLFRKRYSLNVFYMERKNPISTSFMVEENSRVIILPLNLENNHSFGLRMGLNSLRLFKWWNTYINGSLTYKEFRWTTDDKVFKNNVTTPMLHVSNQLSLMEGWSGEIMGYCSGRMMEGQTTIEPLWTISLGIRKNLLNNKFSMYIYAQDIFHSKRPRVSVESNYLHYTSKERNDSQVVGISLAYRFSKGKEIQKSKSENKIEESKRLGL